MINALKTMVSSFSSASRSLYMKNVIASTIVLLGLVGSLPADDKRPNIVMIVVDDLRFDEIAVGGHPYIETPQIDRLAADGAMFTSAYHVTPLCSPNRASLLTGQYVSRHGILDNTSRAHASHRLDLFPKELQKAGYRTAHVGKWHMGNDPTPRPGYDYWVSFAGQGKTNDPDLYEDGRIHPVKGYITDIFTDRAIDFIKGSDNTPFFIYVGHKAVHPESKQRDDGSIDLSVPRGFRPAARHRGRYDDKVIERRPNYGFSAEERLTKPVIKKALDIRRELEKDEAWKREIDPGISENTIRRRAEMVLAVDEGLGRIIETLESMGELDNTLIIFTSDNGYFYGEHGLAVERRLPYEESVRTPLLMRYPKLVEPGTRIQSPVVSIDIAPTVLDVAGVAIPQHVQGRSLTHLLSGSAENVHDAILIEFYSHENPFPWTANLDYRVVRMGRYKYIRWIRFESEAELYDLKTDPYELNNLVSDSNMATVVEGLEERMRQLVLESLGLYD
jgi:N-acetylglucosamine-6-sulfatase